jgi:surfeit locus 1 family protein
MRRFPIALTITAAIACAILIGLGVWQLHRLAWKQALLNQIAALQTAPATPIGAALSRMSRGANLDYTRVTIDCAPAPGPSTQIFRYALREGQVNWRLMTLCNLSRGGPYDGVLLDRGLVQNLAGAMAPSALAVNPPSQVTGILRSPGATPMLGGATPTRQNGVMVVQVVDAEAVTLAARESGSTHPAPDFLAVESESPAPPGVHPAALPRDVPNNHFVYALTWFGLAVVLIWVYGAMVLRRLTHP